MMLVSPEDRQRTLSKGNGYSSGCLWQRVLRSKRSEMYCRAEGVLVPECGAELFGRNRQQIGRGSGGENRGLPEKREPQRTDANRKSLWFLAVCKLLALTNG
jgi:hypothetical protein